MTQKCKHYEFTTDGMPWNEPVYICKLEDGQEYPPYYCPFEKRFYVAERFCKYYERNEE